MKELNNFCDKTIDLRQIFENTHEPIFYDEGHMTDLGNKIIAEKIFKEIKPIVLKN